MNSMTGSNVYVPATQLNPRAAALDHFKLHNVIPAVTPDQAEWQAFSRICLGT